MKQEKQKRWMLVSDGDSNGDDGDSDGDGDDGEWWW